VRPPQPLALLAVPVAALALSACGVDVPALTFHKVGTGWTVTQGD
jgi:hypothetical protein